MAEADIQFIKRASENIRDLEEERGHLDATIRGLEERRRSLHLRIQGAQQALRYYNSLMGNEGREPDLVVHQGDTVTVVEVKTMTPSRHRTSTGPTVAEMCAAYMATHGGEADVSDLASHLIDEGRYTPERRRQAYRLITAILMRDHRRFRRVSPGRYGLTDRPVAATTTGSAEHSILTAGSVAG
jgi:hypothetical protein